MSQSGEASKEAAILDLTYSVGECMICGADSCLIALVIEEKLNRSTDMPSKYNLRVLPVKAIWKNAS